jgi:hypothetical protein
LAVVAKATVHSLTRAERALIAETQPARLRELDEDELVALHGRARRARTKFVTIHRREVAERVQEAGGRGVVSDAPRRSASKAELFESALARVSAALAQAARRSAAELRAERLAAARRVPAAVGAAASAGHDAAPAAPRRASRRPIDRKVASSNRAAGARWQVSRDRRG